MPSPSSSSSHLPRLPLLLLLSLLLLPSPARSAFTNRIVTNCEGSVIGNQAALDQVKKVTSFLTHITAPTATIRYADIYGLAWCRHDLPSSFCFQCLSNAAHSIAVECGPAAAQARSLNDDFCYLRFAMASFYGRLDLSFDRVWIDGGDGVSIREDHKAAFWDTVVRMLNKLKQLMFYEITKFYKLDYGFGLEGRRIYGVSFCSGDLTAQTCGDCLDRAMSVLMARCVNHTNCKVVLWSCFIKYQTK